jgi:hypothetical protein
MQQGTNAGNLNFSYKGGQKYSAIFKKDGTGNNGAVELFWDGSKRIETTSAGATITGSLGVGTVSPTSLLHVTGSLGNSAFVGYIYNDGTQTEDNGLNVQIASSGSSAMGLRVNTGGDSNAFIVAGDGDTGLGFTPSNFAQKLNVNGGVYINGNTGLGTVSPAYKLHCVGTGYFSESVTMASGLTVASATSFGRVTVPNDVNYRAANIAEINSSISFRITKTRLDQTKAIAMGCLGSNNADTGIQCYDTSNDSANTFKIQPFGGTAEFGGSIQATDTSNGYISARTYLQLTAVATPTSGSYIGKLYAYNDTNAALYYKDGANTAHALHSASDYRLKENITDYSGDDAVALVKAAQVKRFDFKENRCPEEHRMNRVGFLAHELQEAGCDLGAVVSLEKDAVDNLGNPRMQSVDYKNLVPVLWAALQDALKRIEDLENK